MKYSTHALSLGLSLSLALLFTGCKGFEPPTLTGDDPVLSEGDATYNYEFTVQLNKDAEREVTLDYATTGVSATAGEDFGQVSGTITIPKGSNSATITIPIYGDQDAEQDESFWISYSNPVNVNIPEPFNTFVLVNDDDGLNLADSGYTTPSSYPDMTLVWSDEFDGTDLDMDNWNYETGNGAGGWGNNELQYYRSGSSNTELRDGFLVITAKEESFGGSQYTSARLTTQGKKEFQYGRIDIRAKLPFGQGIWPALWMLGTNITSVGWPACGETDIMELIGHEPHKVHGTIHYGIQGSSTSIYTTGTYTLNDGDFSDEFHVFSLVWEEDLLKFYVDDNVYHTVSKASIGGQTWRHNNPFFFIFNIAVGGNWPGSPDATTHFPQYMAVDYVRVFQ